MKSQKDCESCVHYDYNEFDDSYECNVNMDEDDFARYSQTSYKECPYYQLYDEYKLVQKQN